MSTLKIEELSKKVKSFGVSLESDIEQVMSNFKLNELHLNEIELEDVDHLEESNKKKLYLEHRKTEHFKSNLSSVPVSRRNNSISSKLPPKVNINIQTLENMNTDSDKLFLQDLSKKKITKSHLESRASDFPSRNLSG